MDADLKNHILKGYKTFEVFDKLKSFVEEIDLIESKANEQKIRISKAQSEIDKLVSKQEDIKSENLKLSMDAQDLLDKAKAEAADIISKAKASKENTAKSEKKMYDDARKKLIELQSEIDELNKEIIPLRDEKESITAEIEKVKDKFRKMI